ncbi:MAG: CDP-glycerol glycerophosphotransferase family protein [Bacteroidales bacterium]|nr:CDP-glycerol glycerophosphotransferase family protein [Bacteroidales bacterium]
MKSIDKSYMYQLRLLWAYKDLLRNHFKPITNWYIRKFRAAQLQAAHKLQGKDCLDVAFFLSIPGMWKHDTLFEAMQKDPHYHPYIVITLYSQYKGFEKDEMMKVLERTRQFAESKGYEYVIPYDDKSGKWLDVKKLYHPDIVFFTAPYKDTLPQNFIYHYKDTLTCYLPYAITSLNYYKTNYNLISTNIVGIYFVETPIHKELAYKYSRNNAENVVVSGHPATEVFLNPNHSPHDEWKKQSKPKKRVIYAPHHSIDFDNNATFMDNGEAILALAEKYSDDIQFAFKPHQLLKFKLQQVWGEEKTEDYYRRWESMENTQLVTDSYEDLFLTSDAMIHDCGSFTVEYIFTQKPVMYLCKDEDMSDKFNPFGIKAFDCHYHGLSIDDIEHFLKDVVVEGNDPMKVQRKQFYDDYLASKDGVLPSQKMLQIIEDTINGK